MPTPRPSPAKRLSAVVPSARLAGQPHNDRQFLFSPQPDAELVDRSFCRTRPSPIWRIPAGFPAMATSTRTDCPPAKAICWSMAALPPVVIAYQCGGRPSGLAVPANLRLAAISAPRPCQTARRVNSRLWPNSSGEMLGPALVLSSVMDCTGAAPLAFTRAGSQQQVQANCYSADRGLVHRFSTTRHNVRSVRLSSLTLAGSRQVGKPDLRQF